MKLLTDITSDFRNKWQALADKSNVVTVFQTMAMYEFYKNQTQNDVVVKAVEEDGVFKGLVLCQIQGEGKGIKKNLTSRAIINGGPLLDENISAEALTLLLTSVISDLRRRCVYVETRNLNDYSRWKNVFEKCGFDYKPHYNFHIDTSEKEVEKRFDKSRRKRIRKAFENGAVLSNDDSCLPSFYSILEDLYRKKIHKPLPPASLFESLLTNPIAKYFFVQSPQGEVIGGQLILMLGHRVAYAWYCCGLDQEYRDFHPSILANYAAIRYAADQGFERFDMMGAGEPGDNYGVREFKAQFGGELVEHGRFLHVNRRLIYTLGKMIVNLKNKA